MGLVPPSPLACALGSSGRKRERTRARETRVSPSCAPVFSCTHYFQGLLRRLPSLQTLLLSPSFFFFVFSTTLLISRDAEKRPESTSAKEGDISSSITLDKSSIEARVEGCLFQSFQDHCFHTNRARRSLNQEMNQWFRKGEFFI